MNAFTRTPTVSAPASTPRSNVVPMPERHIHRERDYGVGYGNSSGYATSRHYAQDWMQPRFRCA